MKTNKVKDFLGTLCVFLFIGVMVLIYTPGDAKRSEYIAEYGYDDEQRDLEYRIKDLEEENSRLEDELVDSDSKLEELQQKYEYDEELINILQQQLESHGIEPEEL